MWIGSIPVCTCTVVPWTQRQPVFPEIQSHVVAMMPFTAGRTGKHPADLPLLSLPPRW